MAIALMRRLWHLPTAYPTAGVVTTMIAGLLLAIAGIASTASIGQNGQAVFPGIFLLLVSFTLLGVAGYAAYTTQFFSNWQYTSGSGYPHALARWIGPIVLILAIVWLLIALLILQFVGDATSKYR